MGCLLISFHFGLWVLSRPPQGGAPPRPLIRGLSPRAFRKRYLSVFSTRTGSLAGPPGLQEVARDKTRLVALVFTRGKALRRPTARGLSGSRARLALRRRLHWVRLHGAWKVTLPDPRRMDCPVVPSKPRTRGSLERGIFLHGILGGIGVILFPLGLWRRPEVGGLQTLGLLTRLRGVSQTSRGGQENGNGTGLPPCFPENLLSELRSINVRGVKGGVSKQSHPALATPKSPSGCLLSRGLLRS